MGLLLLYPYDQNLLVLFRSGNIEISGSVIFFAFILTALLSYVLNFLNLTLIFLAEGYPLSNTALGRFMIRWQREFMAGLKEKANDHKLPKIVRSFYQERLHDDFPLDPERCAPTSLGNVTAAFEAYPMNCYGIDAIYLWPRFVPVLSKVGYSPFVEREKEGVDLFLNLAFLTGLLAFESLICRLILHHTLFTWSMLICGISSYLFYRAAVNAAHSWGESIKTAFDLYRYQLADQLALAPFKDREEEVSRWWRLSQFIQSGESWREFGEYAYLLPDSRHLMSSQDEKQS